MPFDYTETAELTRRVVQIGNAQDNVMTNFIFKPTSDVVMSQNLQWGEWKEQVKVAIWNRIGDPAKPVARPGSTLKSLKFPQIRLSSSLDEVEARSPEYGLASFNGPIGTNPVQMLAEKKLMDSMRLRRMIEDTVEVNAATTLRTGVGTFDYGDSTAAVITFGYTGDAATDTPDLTIQKTKATTELWTDAASDPLAQLEEFADQIAFYGNYSGKFNVIMGSSAWAAFAANTKVKANLDLRRQDGIGNGVKIAQATGFKGTVGDFNLIKYVKSYLNSSAARVEAWPVGLIAVVPADDAIVSQVLPIEHGAIYEQGPDGKMQLLPTQWYSKTVITDDPPSETLIVETRPAPLMKNPNVVRICTVVV